MYIIKNTKNKHFVYLYNTDNILLFSWFCFGQPLRHYVSDHVDFDVGNFVLLVMTRSLRRHLLNKLLKKM